MDESKRAYCTGLRIIAWALLAAVAFWVFISPAEELWSFTIIS